MPGKNKHVPERMCVACREMRSQRNMFRLVEQSGALVWDQDYKLNGRGYYLCKQEECLERAFSGKKRLSNMKAKLEPELQEQLLLGLEKEHQANLTPRTFVVKRDGSIERTKQEEV